MLHQLRAAAWALRRVAANSDIRRAEVAWMLGWAAEWTWLVALFVFAYGVGGVQLVAWLGLARTLPAGILAPALSSLADRGERHRVLLAVHSGRAVVSGIAALVAATQGPWWLLLVIAPLDGLLGVLHRPSHMSMMPSLARSPEDLVAANVASSTLEAIGILSGPVLGGLLVATGMPALAFAAPAVMFGVAAIAIGGVHPGRSIGQQPTATGGADLLLGGLRALVRSPHAALMLGLFGLQTLVRGALSVLLVVAAIELLGIGEEGVGYLNAAIGAGGFIGALAAMGLLGGRLAPTVALALAAWGLPIVVIGVVPGVAAAFLSLAVVGAANAILDISGFTLMQRTVPNAVRARVFGLLEAIVMLTVGLGAAVAPVLISAFGSRGALIAAGSVLPLASAAGWWWLRRADDKAVVPASELELLRMVPMLRPLPLTVLEELAGQMQRHRYAEGSTIIREGEAGDSFYVLVTGSAEASSAGRPLRNMTAGDSFGEIALLRDVPRTATVNAASEVEAMILSRTCFLAAVTGDRSSLQAADDVVAERLTTTG